MRAVNTGGAAYLGGKALVPERPVTESFRTNLSERLDGLRNPHIAKTLNRELQEVAGYARGKLVETVGTSWDTLLVGKDPDIRGQGTLLAETEVTDRGASRSTAALESGLWGPGQMQDEGRSPFHTEDGEGGGREKPHEA